MSQILLAKLEGSTLKILTTILKTEGYKTVSADSVQDASAQATSADFGLMIADASSLSGAELELLRDTKAKKPSMALIVISSIAQDISPLAEQDIFARLQKPFKMDELLAGVQRALDFGEQALSEMASMRVHLQTAYRFNEVVAESPGMRSVCDMISRIAATDVNVLITGERGTGKTLMARVIHAHSMRKNKEYVVVDCRNTQPGAMETLLFGGDGAHGSLEKANGGTVFLSGVEALPVPVQRKLLGLLRERHFAPAGTAKPARVDLRFLAAGEAPEAAAKAGRLNEELFGILKAISIVIPPLRDRVEDVEPLVGMALGKLAGNPASAPGVEPAAMRALMEYRWPGNVKELEDVMRFAMLSARGKSISAQMLPAHLQKQKS